MFYIDGDLCLQCIFVYPIKVSYLILFLSSLVNAGLLCFCCFLCGSPLLLFLRVAPIADGLIWRIYIERVFTSKIISVCLIAFLLYYFRF